MILEMFLEIECYPAWELILTIMIIAFCFAGLSSSRKA